MVEEYSYQKLKNNFEKSINDFCYKLWGRRENIIFQVLEKEEQQKTTKTKQSIKHVLNSKQKENISKDNIESKEFHIISLQIDNKGNFVLEYLMHEILHVYRPADSEREVEEMEESLAISFEIWEKLYNYTPLREYFMDLFKDKFLRPNEKDS
jgi:hypothetical protein